MRLKTLRSKGSRAVRMPRRARMSKRLKSKSRWMNSSFRPGCPSTLTGTASSRSRWTPVTTSAVGAMKKQSRRAMQFLTVKSWTSKIVVLRLASMLTLFARFRSSTRWRRTRWRHSRVAAPTRKPPTQQRNSTGSSVSLRTLASVASSR